MLDHLNTSDFTAVPNSNFGYLLIANEPGAHHLLLKTGAGELYNLLLRENELEDLELFRGRLKEIPGLEYTGTAHQLTEFQLNLLSDIPVSIGISQLGWNDAAKIWFFHNAALTTDGRVHAVSPLGQVVVDGELYFLTYYASLKERSPKGIDFHLRDHVATSLTLADWATAVSRVYGLPGRIGVLFALATAFSDLVFERLNFFPLLFACGEPASGKSSLLRALRALFGSGLENSYQITSPGLLRMLSFSRNTMTGLDEFIADPVSSVQVTAIAARMPYKLFVRGAGVPFTTRVIEGTLMVLSNEHLNKPEDSSNVIAMEMARPDTSPEGQQAYCELHEHVTAGYSGLIGEVIMHRATVEREFNTHFEAHFAELKDRPGQPEGWDGRMLSSYAMLHAIADCLLIVEIDGHSVQDDLVHCLIEQQAALAMPASR